MRVAESEDFWAKNLEVSRKLWAKNILHYAVIFLSSLFYSLHVKFSLGADYGIYFVGAKFSSVTFPLYEGFFDHKGPFTYLTGLKIQRILKIS